MKVKLTRREQDTVIAALRYWQDRNLPRRVEDARKLLDLEQVIATEHGPALDTEEIDRLCDRLNR